jgi:probable rRNA maturation factor
VLLVLEEPASTLTVVFVNAARMQDLNREYLGRDYATDVLSFAYPGETAGGFPFLGEIVIAPEVAARQARRWRTSPDREMRRLLAHGLLHLLGYDHETDEGGMLRLQRRLLRRRAVMQAELVVEMREES